MNGAESIVHTLLDEGVDVCFANPGTSEMHFVAALDRIDGMRCILGLFEGVVTGAADGYGRMADKPAATLLHLGPGLANGLANLHNAKRAYSPILNVVGDHAVYHKQYDSPLTSDVEGVARPFSAWVRTSPTARGVAADTAEAIVTARTGRIATLILPANTAWDPADGPAKLPASPAPQRADKVKLAAAARLIQAGPRTGIILGGKALRADALALAGKIAARTGARILGPYAPSRLERGAGRVAIEPIPYAVDLALSFLADFKDLVLVGGELPVAFFAYPGKPSITAPKDCGIHVLAEPRDDLLDVLRELVDATGAGANAPDVVRFDPPEPATGAVTAVAMGQSIAALLPDNVIVADELASNGRDFSRFTRAARPHDFMKNVGGAIGWGLPAATGAAVACPDRKVVCLQADGSAMYTIQALWTQAREKLDVVNVIFANRTYATLKNELVNVRAGNAGPKAMDMLEIGRPDIDFCAVSRGLGVDAVRVTDMEAFNREFAAALSRKGPYLIEVIF